MSTPVRPAPRTAPRASASTSGGKDSTESIARISSPSIVPPQSPATRPRTLPASSASVTDTKPATSETRVPHTTRDRTSRPTLSVPSQWRAPGFASALPRFCLSGSCGASAGAPKARASAIKRIAAPSLVETDPRIDEPIEDVDEEIAEDEAHGDQQHDTLHERVVAGEDRVHHQAADAGQREDVLGDDGAADQRAELEPEHGDHRDQGVAQDVTAHHAPLRQALGARRAHVVLGERLQQARAQ